MQGRLRSEIEGSTTRNYIYGADGVVGYEENGMHFMYRKNIFGDITAIYKGATKVAEYKYDAWGNCTIILNTSGYGSRNPFRYRGYYFDSDLGMYYLTTRYYDPKTGRFINADSIEYLKPDKINGLNLYAYCGNNPIMYVDLYGHDPVIWGISLYVVLEIVQLIALLGVVASIIALICILIKAEEDKKSEDETNAGNEEFEKLPLPDKKIPICSGPIYPISVHYPLTADDVSDEVLGFHTYVGSFPNRLGGRLNDPKTYTSKYNGPYDSFNSGNPIFLGSGLGSWGDIMEEFFDEYGFPDD